MKVDGSRGSEPQPLRNDRNSSGKPEPVSEFITNLPTKIGNVSIRFDVTGNDRYLRFKLDSNTDSLPDFSISINKDGNAVKFIEPNAGSSCRAIEDLSKQQFHGIPSSLTGFILKNKPERPFRAGSEITPPSTPLPSDLETIQKKFKNSQFYLLEAHCGKPSLSFLSADKKAFFIQEHWKGAENGTMHKDIKLLYCLHKDIEPRVFSIGNDCYGTTSVIQIDENYKNAIIHSLVSVLGHHHENLNEACVMINTGHSYPIGDMLLDLGLNVFNLQRIQQNYQVIERERHKFCKSFSL